MSALTVLDLGGERDAQKVAFFLDDFFKFCSDRLVVLYNGDSCKLLNLKSFRTSYGVTFIFRLLCYNVNFL